MTISFSVQLVPDKGPFYRGRGKARQRDAQAVRVAGSKSKDSQKEKRQNSAMVRDILAEGFVHVHLLTKHDKDSRGICSAVFTWLPVLVSLDVSRHFPGF